MIDPLLQAIRKHHAPAWRSPIVCYPVIPILRSYRRKRPQNHVAMLEIADIQQFVARQLAVSLNDLLSHRRSGSLSMKRHIAMWLAYKRSGAGTTTVGRAFNRDHTTILHAVSRIDELMKSDESLKNRMANLEKALEARA